MGTVGCLPWRKPGRSRDEKPCFDICLKSLVVVVCLLNGYYCIRTLPPRFPPARQLLSSGTAAAIAALEASSEQVEVEGISSKGAAPLTDGPFQFPRIIHQTVEDKSNVSCEALSCMKTWMDLNPGYEHRLVDAAGRREFVATNFPEVRSRALGT